jgi:galactose mutarotase-like enzyme
LPLADDLFRDGALIFDRLASRRVSYGAPGASRIEVAFPGMPHLGIWTKPGAGFVCIEPWQGFASPEDFDGDFAERPGVVPISPGHARAFEMSITVP